MINEEQIVKLRQEGYTDDQIRQVIEEEMSKRYDGGYDEEDARAMASNTLFSAPPADNLIKWQLRVDDVLERAEHILRGDRIKFERGNMIWVENPNPDERPFNEYGVSEIMSVLSTFVNRVIMLGDYTPDEIEDIIYDVGTELSDFIYMKYEQFGMDTPEKRKRYPMIVMQLTMLVYASYKRAMFGRERDSLREARQVTQTEPIHSVPVSPMTGQPLQERSVFNPMRYLDGQYKR